MSQNVFWKSETCRNVWNYWRSPPLWDERHTLQLLKTEAAWRQGRGASIADRLSQLQNISICRDCQEQQLPQRLHRLVHYGHWTLKSCQVMSSRIKSCRICVCSTNSTKLLSLHFGGGWTVPTFPVEIHRSMQVCGGLWREVFAAKKLRWCPGRQSIHPSASRRSGFGLPPVKSHQVSSSLKVIHQHY